MSSSVCGRAARLPALQFGRDGGEQITHVAARSGTMFAMFAMLKLSYTYCCQPGCWTACPRSPSAASPRLRPPATIPGRAWHWFSFVHLGNSANFAAQCLDNSVNNQMLPASGPEVYVRCKVVTSQVHALVGHRLPPALLRPIRVLVCVGYMCSVTVVAIGLSLPPFSFFYLLKSFCLERIAKPAQLFVSRPTTTGQLSGIRRAEPISSSKIRQEKFHF